MIWHPIIAAFVTFITTLKAAIPAFNYHLGGYHEVADPTSIDGSSVSRALASLVVWDRFLPIHDALLPACLFSIQVVAAFLVIKTVKFIISCIPTVSGSG
jgi:hypothetical protein